MKIPNNSNKSEEYDIPIALLNDIERWKDNHHLKYAHLRRHPRYPPKHKVHAVEIEHPGGSCVKRTIHVFDICTAGAGLIHKGYIHQGTAITLNLRTNDDETIAIKAIVCWCYYLIDQMHSIGVRFASQVNPKLLVDEDEWMNHTSQESHDIWKQTRNAIVIQPNIHESRAIHMLAQNANIVCTIAETSGEAVNLLQQSNYDLIITDDDIPNESCPETIELLRNSMYAGPLLVTSNNTSTRSDILEQAGADSVLSKPVRLKQFLSSLRDLFTETEQEENNSAPIYTSLDEAHCSNENITEFVLSIKVMGTKLAECLTCSDLDFAIELCNTIYYTAAGYGYESLSESAADAIKSMRASCSVEESKADIRKLIRMIGQIKDRDQYIS